MQQKTKVADHAIRRLYWQGESLSDAEQQPFQKLLEDMLALAIADKESWIQQTDHDLPAAHLRDDNQAESQQHVISTFL